MTSCIREWTRWASLAVIGASLLFSLLAIADLLRALLAPLLGLPFGGATVLADLGRWLAGDLLLVGAYAVRRDDERTGQPEWTEEV
jgi:hypothetical protein